MAGEGAYDIDCVVDDSGAGIDDHGISVIVATLIAVWDGWQFLNDDSRHGAETVLPAGGQGSIAIVLFAQAGWQVAWAVVVADEVVVILVAEVALVLLVVAPSVAVPIAVAMLVVIFLIVVMAVSMSVAVSVFAAVSLCDCLGRWECKANCDCCEEQGAIGEFYQE